MVHKLNGTPERQKINIQDMDEALQSLWNLASSLPKNNIYRLQLREGGASGVTAAELRHIEETAGTMRRTVTGDPPIRVDVGRSEKGKSFVRIYRKSRGSDLEETILELRGGFNLKGELSTMDGQPDIEATLLGVIQKVNGVKSKIIDRITRDNPNQLFFRQPFETVVQDAIWVQLSSPKFDRGEPGQDQYRVYIDPQVSDIGTYFRMLNEIVETARSYTAHPLGFKFMYGGSRAKDVIMDPDATKIVFYFTDKNAALQFGQYLEQRLHHFPHKKRSPQRRRRFIPQQEWSEGLIILGKGTREERRDLAQQAAHPSPLPSMRERMLDRMRQLSITL